MSYKTIVVHLDAGRRRRARLDLAFTLAERFDAHLIGLFGLEPAALPTVPEAAPTLIETMYAQRRAASEEAAAEFETPAWPPCIESCCCTNSRQGDARWPI